MTTCCICEDSFEDQSTVTRIPLCRHIFHPNCCKEYFESKIADLEWQCPYCMKQLKMKDLRVASEEIKVFDRNYYQSLQASNEQLTQLQNMSLADAANAIDSEGRVGVTEVEMKDFSARKSIGAMSEQFHVSTQSSGNITGRDALDARYSSANINQPMIQTETPGYVVVNADDVRNARNRRDKGWEVEF